MPPNSKPQLKVLPRPATNLDLALEIFIPAKEAERCTPCTIWIRFLHTEELRIFSIIRGNRLCWFPRRAQ